MSRPDWRYRPVKYVERRMIAEALQRLHRLASLDSYRYVGFGALHFVDFVLFHRILGINEMISIEQNTRWKDRYLFNRPFRSVDVQFGHSTDLLPQLDWSGLQIVWLDYDRQLTRAILQDVEYLIHRLLPGSVLICTVNCQAAVRHRLKALQSNLDPEVIDPRLTEQKLRRPWEFSNVQYDVLSDVVQEALSRRSDRATSLQLFNFRYRDGARMQTVGWVVSAPNVISTLEMCRFSELQFVREGRSAYEITVPQLTRREVDYLSRLLPTDEVEGVDWLSDEELMAYASLYRWYPREALL